MAENKIIKILFDPDIKKDLEGFCTDDLHSNTMAIERMFDNINKKYNVCRCNEISYNIKNMIYNSDPSFLKYLDEIPKDLFYHCLSLPNFFTIPNNIKIIGESSFNTCLSLKEVDIENGAKKIDSYAFAYCTNLEVITFSESLSSIGDCVFKYCTHLKKIVLPEGLKTIGALAFDNCVSLELVEIPKSIKTIGGNAFIRCQNLKEIKYNSTMRDWSNIKFGSPDGITIKCTDGNL